MRTLKEHIHNLAEDEASDIAYRHEAERVYGLVRDFLRSHRVEGSLEDFLYARDDGGVVAPISRLGVSGYQNLYVIFAPKDPSGPLGGFGFTPDGYPVLLFYILMGPHDLRYMDTRLPKETFVHEFIHYLDWKRSEGKIRGPARRSGGITNISDYVNNPSEFNAYFQEGILGIETLAKYVPLTEIETLFGGTAEEFIMLAKRKYFESFFVDNLNPDYTRKLEKRLYRYYVDTLLPKINKRQELSQEEQF